MTDFKKFTSELYNYFISEKRNFDDFYLKIKDLDCIDFRLHFYKAHWLSKQMEGDKIKEAVITIEKAIDSLFKVSSKNDSIIADNAPMLWYDDGSVSLPFEGSYTKEYKGKNLPKAKDVFFLAGEIYAKADKEDKALECYQKYQYFVSRLKAERKGEVTVYSFRKYSEYSLADLINNEITVAHPSEMNDPFDSIANLWCTPENLKLHCNDEKHLIPLKKSYDYFRIRSFVANKDTFESDDTILKNILMWSHYADGHKGFCVKYRLSEHFVKQEENDKFEHMYLKPINYLRKEDNVRIDVPSIDTDLAYATKYRCWEYESEVRLISYNTSINGKFLGIPLDERSKIEAIYLGYNFSEKQKEAISNILSKYTYKIKLYNTRMNKENVYDLKLEEYKETKD